MESGEGIGADRALRDGWWINHKKMNRNSAVLQSSMAPSLADPRMSGLLRSAAAMHVTTATDSVSVSRAILRWRIGSFMPAGNYGGRTSSIPSIPETEERNPVPKSTRWRRQHAHVPKTELLTAADTMESATVQANGKNSEKGTSIDDGDSHSDSSTVVAVREKSNLDELVVRGSDARTGMRHITLDISQDGKSMVVLPVQSIGRHRSKRHVLPPKPVVYPELEDVEGKLSQISTTATPFPFEKRHTVSIFNTVAMDNTTKLVDNAAVSSSSSDEVFINESAASPRALSTCVRGVRRQIIPSSKYPSFAQDDYLTFTAPNKNTFCNRSVAPRRNRFLRWASKSLRSKTIAIDHEVKQERNSDCR
jgi:hypothetical protein